MDQQVSSSSKAKTALLDIPCILDSPILGPAWAPPSATRNHPGVHLDLQIPNFMPNFMSMLLCAVYAPVQREGRFPETKPAGQEIETEGFAPATLAALSDLETSLPAKMLNPKLRAPKPPAKLNYQQRQAAAVQCDVENISQMLETAKATAGRGFGDVWPYPIDKEPSGTGIPTRTTTVRPAGKSCKAAQPCNTVG